MKKYIPLILATFAVAFFAFRLISNYDSYFNEVNREIVANNSIVLDKQMNTSVLSDILTKNGYVDDAREATFIANAIKEKINANNASLQNLNDLKKRVWQVPLDDYADFHSLDGRSKMIKSDLGYDDLSEAATMAYKAGDGDRRISVIVTERNKAGSNLVYKLLGKDKVPMDSVYVRITQHSFDGIQRNDSVMGYLMTDQYGKVEFSGLNDSTYYSVLPIGLGYEFGQEQGTTHKPFGETKGVKAGVLKLNFNGRTSSIRLLADNTLQTIRNDKHLLVRTPNDFKKSLTTNVAIIIILFWVVAYLVSRRNRSASTMLLSLLMAITGVGVVNMYSLSDPLVDSILGEQNAKAVIIGLLVMCVLVNVDFVKFYQNRYFIKFDIVVSLLHWLCLPYRQKIKPLAKAVGDSRNNPLLRGVYSIVLLVSLPLTVLNLLTPFAKYIKRIPQGTGYLIAAIVLTLLLFTPLGTEVGGMKVNLDLGVPVQPSEVAKYLLVFFMAAYFTQNAKSIISYSQQSNMSGSNLARKIRFMLFFILGILALMVLYLLLSDMGPALVILTTFVIFYSLIKSTVEVSPTDNAKIQLGAILSCDMATLIYGVITFLICLYIGSIFGVQLISAALWFVGWILLFLSKKQIRESAILFNLIITLFVFGGLLLAIFGFDSEAERFTQRIAMCTNTWGDLAIAGGALQPTSNSQVANGLWALASGGLTGQGIGYGMTQVIPAFNTDMVMISFGENMGFIGIAVMLTLYFLLLWQTFKVGYLAKQTFALYLCMGIAVVTGVQLLVIVLGSVGLIPLTGVTVPFMSFGMSSLIMNLTAYGVVLSVLAHANAKNVSVEAQKLLSAEAEKYNYPIAVLSAAGILILLILSAAFLKYMVWERDDTMARPVFATSWSGRAVIDYNPRLLAIADEMLMGNILDRKGVVLATSNKSKINADALYRACSVTPDTAIDQKRYYPFGRHLFFMLGDFNTRLFFNSNESNPVGYLAEAQHLSDIRGYDNRYRVDDQGKHITEPYGGRPLHQFQITSADVSTQRFMPRTQDSYSTYLRDYSPLVPYAKAGLHSDRLRRFNNRTEGFFDFDKIEPKDVQLTIDAELQVRLQNALARQCNDKYYDRPAVRVSAVILDAKNGDLLTSAVYPLPDYDILKSEFADKGVTYYTDNNRPADWTAYTDRDLGLTYQTAPGSTAKVISAMAGYASGQDHARQLIDGKKYMVYDEEIIERGSSPEPHNRMVSLDDALVESSNCYFINLVNDWQLYDELGDIYANVGVGIATGDPANPGRPAYYLNYVPLAGQNLASWQKLINDNAHEGIRAYNRYIDNRKKTGKKRSMQKPEMWCWAWGQGGKAGAVVASPLNMARVVSAVVNEGEMPLTRYVLSDTGDPGSVRLMEAAHAADLKTHMYNQASYNNRKVRYNFTTDADDRRFGGKTGTPERDRKVKGRWIKSNDAWYIFYIDGAEVPTYNATTKKHETVPTSLAIALRIERSGHGRSDEAMLMAGETVIRTLREMNYIK